MIEKGRYLNVPRKQRLCTSCNQIEDGMHISLITVSNNYKQIRSQLVNDNKSQISMFKNYYET